MSAQASEMLVDGARVPERGPELRLIVSPTEPEYAREAWDTTWGVGRVCLDGVDVIRDPLSVCDVDVPPLTVAGRSRWMPSQQLAEYTRSRIGGPSVTTRISVDGTGDVWLGTNTRAPGRTTTSYSGVIAHGKDTPTLDILGILGGKVINPASSHGLFEGYTR